MGGVWGPEPEEEERSVEGGKINEEPKPGLLGVQKGRGRVQRRGAEARPILDTRHGSLGHTAAKKGGQGVYFKRRGSSNLGRSALEMEGECALFSGGNPIISSAGKGKGK